LFDQLSLPTGALVNIALVNIALVNIALYGHCCHLPPFAGMRRLRADDSHLSPMPPKHPGALADGVFHVKLTHRYTHQLHQPAPEVS